MAAGKDRLILKLIKHHKTKTMKITQLFTEQKEREIEFEAPAFYNEGSFSKVAVYSENNVISVTVLRDGWLSVRKSSIADYWNFIDLVTKAERITEEEFTLALNDAIMDIVGREIAPNSVTELIPA
jgi:hypothetical protein